MKLLIGGILSVACWLKAQNIYLTDEKSLQSTDKEELVKNFRFLVVCSFSKWSQFENNKVQYCPLSLWAFLICLNFSRFRSLQCYSLNEVSLLLMCLLDAYSRPFLLLPFLFLCVFLNIFTFCCSVRTNGNVSGSVECGKLC